MQLCYGGGWHSAFLNIRDSKIEEYSRETADSIHDKYGGRQYYSSRSGMSGAGWIEDALHVRDQDELSKPSSSSIRLGVTV